MGNFGTKISQPGKDVRLPVTESNKKDFRVLTTNDALLEKETSSSPSNTNVFLGYCLDDTKARSLNYEFGDKVYIIYDNTFA